MEVAGKWMEWGSVNIKITRNAGWGGWKWMEVDGITGQSFGKDHVGFLDILDLLFMQQECE